MTDDARATHWIRGNEQCRIPKRWVAFDTESRTDSTESEEVQSWRTGTAVRWRRDLKTGIHEEAVSFGSPQELWAWVDGYCRKGVRTIVVAHNLGHDVRIAQVLDILPTLGWELEWCNLDRNVSAMTWRSDHGTLVFADLATWLPMPLFKVGEMLGLPKLRMPGDGATDSKWDAYCMRDTAIVALAMRELCDFIEEHNLGNWQPTGAGMAYSTWRHKFMTHKVMVHDNAEVLDNERAAMHTGRAEAWRHGKIVGETWHEVDMRNAYTRIAAATELPAKYKFSCDRLSLRQYEVLTQTYRVLCRVSVDTNLPVVPFDNGERTLWPVGIFSTWLWDCEVDELIAAGSAVIVEKCHVYTKGRILGDWGVWILALIHAEGSGISPVARAWAKHCGRALIGRLSLRIPTWELYGGNPMGETGITHDVDYNTGSVTRMMHVGDKTFHETDRREGRDSLPQVTGYIMAQCRVLLWRAMVAAGFDNIAHVDTDSVLVNSSGLVALRAHYAGGFDGIWQVKSTWPQLIVYGPRNLRAGRERKVSGVPKRAKEVSPNVFVGELWHGLATDVEHGRSGAVTVTRGRWELKRGDPRRSIAGSGAGRTVAIRVVGG